LSTSGKQNFRSTATIAAKPNFAPRSRVDFFQAFEALEMPTGNAGYALSISIAIPAFDLVRIWNTFPAYVGGTRETTLAVA